jgi:hypothetical protein
VVISLKSFNWLVVAMEMNSASTELGTTFLSSIYEYNRSQRPLGPRHGQSWPARTLGSWVRIPLKAWMSVHVLCVCAVLCAGSSLATG